MVDCSALMLLLSPSVWKYLADQLTLDLLCLIRPGIAIPDLLASIRRRPSRAKNRLYSFKPVTRLVVYFQPLFVW